VWAKSDVMGTVWSGLSVIPGLDMPTHNSPQDDKAKKQE
jgi:hypothetical protein